MAKLPLPKLENVGKRKPVNKVKSKSLTGEAAAKELQKRTSPKGVKEFEKRASKALDKKYPRLYKKSTPAPMPVKDKPSLSIKPKGIKPLNKKK